MLLGLYPNDPMILVKAFTDISHKTHTKNIYTKHTRCDTSTIFNGSQRKDTSTVMLLIYSIFLKLKKNC